MFTLVLPFYNGDWQKLKTTLPIIKDEATLNSVAEIILAHNGLPMTAECEEFCKIETKVDGRIKYAHTDKKGIGAGYKLGIKAAHQDFVVLSASDLPFGWSDIKSFQELARTQTTQFAIGSKAHTSSKIHGRNWKRRISTLGFYFLRAILLGSDTPKDSQGTLIIFRTLASQLAEQSQFDNYLCSLELATIALSRNIPVFEIAVVLQNEIGASAVSIKNDGAQMIKDLFKLRKRFRKI